MTPEIPDTTCIYRIDGSDRITDVSGYWLSFAAENLATESCHPDRILGRVIWEFIDGSETRHLYEIILNRVRQAGMPVTLPFRCDSPDRRRYLELAIVPVGDDAIEFYSSILREEPRETVELLNPEARRSDEYIKMCSSCKKINRGENRWVEVEAGIAELRLFESPLLPQITHGLCGDCYNAWMSSLKELHTQHD